FCSIGCQPEVLITTGLPPCSFPVITLNACCRKTTLLFSSVSATTYRVPVDGSITGVPVTPFSGKIVLCTRACGTVVAPDGSRLVFHKGDPAWSASKA